MTDSTQGSPAERRRRQDVLENEIHLRLHNWSRAVRGGYLRDALARPPDETLPAPVLADAEVVEKAMLRMKKLRPRQYKALRVMYIFRYGDLAAAEVCRVSPTRYRELVREGYNYLAGALPQAG